MHWLILNGYSKFKIFFPAMLSIFMAAGWMKFFETFPAAIRTAATVGRPQLNRIDVATEKRLKNWN